MPFAVTHVLLTMLLVDLYRDYFAVHRRLFTMHTVFIAGVGGLLPDIDIPVNWMINFFGLELAHRTITHTFAFALVFLIPAVFLWLSGRHKLSTYFFVVAFGIVFHLFLDVIMTGSDVSGVMLLWPLSSHVFYGFFSLSALVATSIDALLLLGWLYHEERKHKILDYV